VFTAEFLNLCQTQIDFLRDHFGATETAIYWTEHLSSSQDEGVTPTLIPVLVYPEDALTNPDDRTNRDRFPLVLLPSGQAEKIEPRDMEEFIELEAQDEANQSYQEVLPLLYQEEMMGLLVIRRLQIPWQVPELNHIEKIGETLAIASSLEKKLQQAHRLHGNQQQQIGDLLHQLKNPLTAITTFAKLLAKKILTSDRNYKLVTGIQRESDRLKLLLEKFGGSQEPKTLPFAAAQSLLTSSDFLSSGDRVIKLKPLLEEALLSAQAIATEKQINLTWKLPAQLPPIPGDSGAFHEMVMNLLENAIKYTPPGGKVALVAGIEKMEGHTTYHGIAIADTGYGIPLGEQSQIFNRTYRGSNTKNTIAGSGLGLAIVKELLTNLGGAIELLSPNGLAGDGGTTFTIWLPATTN
jgi:signal transduction histidine kinase